MPYPPRPKFSTPSPAERNALFGSFQYQNKGDGTIRILGGWESQNIVRVHIPQLIGVEGAPKTGIVAFHKKGASQLQAFFQAVEDSGLQHLILSWAGSFYPRFIRGSKTALSNHSWGTAFDINAAWNGLNKTPPSAGQKGSLVELVPIANEFGFFWGGHYNSRLDGMHFELAVLNKFHKTFLIENTVSAAENQSVVLPKDAPSSTTASGETPNIATPPITIQGEIAPDENEAGNTAQTLPQTSPDTTQNAENITNITTSEAAPKVEGAAQLPTTTIEGTKPTGLGSKLAAFFTAIFTGQYLVPQFVTDNSAGIFSGVFLVLGKLLQGLYDNRYLVFGGLALWYIGKKVNNYLLTAKVIDTNANPELGNVVLVKNGKPPFYARLMFWK